MKINLVFFNHPFENNTDKELSRTYTVFPDMINSTPPPLKYI